MARHGDRATFIGRHLRLKDLRVFMTVARSGSMARAADQLDMSQPAISALISELEHGLRMRLFERHARGVRLTPYGTALLARGITVFDELNQGLAEMESLADATVGEVRIGCPESICAAFLPRLLEEFKRKHSGIVVHVENVSTRTLDLPELRERRLELVLARVLPSEMERVPDGLDVRVLFNDQVVIAAGQKSPFARRNRIDLAELIEQRWVMTGAMSESLVAQSCRRQGLREPRASVVTYSVHLRASLLATGDYLASFPASVVRANGERYGLKVLPVRLEAQPWPIALVTLKGRALNPVAQRFIEHVQAFLSPLQQRDRQANTALRT